MGRTALALLVPAAALTTAWLRLEDPRQVAAAVAVCLLGALPAFVPPGRARIASVLIVVPVAVSITFQVRPWGLLPFRDERVVRPVLDGSIRGLNDFFGVGLPFRPVVHPEMHALVLMAIFAAMAATALLVAGRHAYAASAVVIVGVAWPGSLRDPTAGLVGGAALAAALSIPLVLRARSVPRGLVGALLGAAVVGVAVWSSAATSLAGGVAFDWGGIDLRGASAQALGVRTVWDSNYDGISFPKTKTTVLRIDGPRRYWRASTLDDFAAYRWLQAPIIVGEGTGSSRVPPDPLSPARARDPASWVESRVTVKALVDDRLVSPGTVTKIDAPSLENVLFLLGGTIRTGQALDAGTKYRTWSYVPHPSAAVLERARARYPPAAERFLNVGGGPVGQLPPFGAKGRDARVRQAIRSSYDLSPYAAVYATARRVSGRAKTPYEAVIALESWFRFRGGFRYDESPPPGRDDPLVRFITQSRAGYCQHFAGAMALMLRYLGVPARVAVGFTSGHLENGVWTVTDHDAHAWVEAWFPGQGWVPFDPTPGRGTVTGAYSVASPLRGVAAGLIRGDFGVDLGQQGAIPTKKPAARPARGSGRPSALLLALLAGVAAACVIGLSKAVVRHTRHLSRDPRRVALSSRQHLVGYLRDQGVAVPANATLSDLARLASLDLGVDASRLVVAVGQARFGRPGHSSATSTAVRQELRVFLRRARSSLSSRRRLRGFVSLRCVRHA